MTDTATTDTVTTDTATPAAAESRSVSLSAQAARRVAELRRQQGDERLMLRVTVSGGGCSGFQYGFGFDGTVNEDDLTFERDGVTMVIDDVSLDLLNGAEVDYVEELIGASFQIRNPNASSSCGCGASFAV
jgi:iron-sulfur cluster insertion protein